MLIALDIDGVLVNLDSHMQKVAQNLFGIPMNKISNAYAFHKRYQDLSLDMENALWDHMEATEQWAEAPVFEDAHEAVALLRDADFKLMCISAAPKHLTEQRKQSLEVLDLHETDVICTGEGGPSTLANKRHALRHYAPDVFVDDQLHNLIQARECNIPYLSWVDIGDEQIHIEPGTNWEEVAHHRGNTLLEVAQHLVDAYKRVPIPLRKRTA